MAEINYQANHEDGESSFDALPAGEYPVVIVNSDYSENKQGTGKMLKLEYQVIDGPMQGRKIFENLNIEHENEQTVQISRKALNSICAALGVVELKDSAQLHNSPLRIDVTVKDNAEYGKQNRIKKHSSFDGKPAAPQSQIPDAPNGNGNKKKPWEK